MQIGWQLEGRHLASPLLGGPSDPRLICHARYCHIDMGPLSSLSVGHVASEAPLGESESAPAGPAREGEPVGIPIEPVLAHTEDGGRLLHCKQTVRPFL